MNYTLKHKNIDVATLSFFETGEFTTVLTVHNLPHLPVCAVNEGEEVNAKYMHDWWDGRGIPKNREGLDEVLAKCSKRSKNELLIKSLGLSLTDHYWVCPEGDQFSWEQINFYDNTFSPDIGNLFFHRGIQKNDFDENSPDNSSDGQLKKRWEIEPETDKRILIKEGVLPYCQEPFNEKIVSYICSKFNLPFVNYEVKKEDAIYVSHCENMTNQEIELVYASRIFDVFAKNINDNKIEHYSKCCRKLCGIDVTDTMNKMLVLDYIINNSDRHWNNFGMLRDSTSLKYTGIAPIFDSENSLWKNLSENMIRPLLPVKTKCCGNTVTDQLNFVTDFSWYKPDMLKGIGAVFLEYLVQNDNINENRRAKIANGLDLRVKELERIIAAHPSSG
jgi:hypothetical protein